MVKNKLLSLGMAVVMALSTSVVTFADTTITSPNSKGKYSGTVVATGSTAAPVIDVTVPTSVEISINPYRLRITETSLLDVSGSDATHSIISPTYTITSQSNIGLSVRVGVKATIPSGSGVSLKTTALTGNETSKALFSYIEIINKGDSFADEYTDADNQVILSKTYTSKNDACFLAAGTADSPSEALIKIFGEANPSPKKAWTTKDKVTIAITLTFIPVAGTGL
jgi:hypothetical protein